MGQIGLREQVPQKAGSGPAAGPAVGLGQNFQVFYFQQVAGSRPLNVDGAGQGMGYLGVQISQVRRGHPGLNLVVGSIPGFQQDLLARRHFQDGRQVGMPAVMALFRFLFQSLGAVDGNAFHFSSPPDCGSRVMYRDCWGILGRRLFSVNAGPALAMSQVGP